MLKISPNAFDASSTNAVRQSSINAVQISDYSIFGQKHFQSKALCLSRYYLQKCRFSRSILPIMAILSFSLIAKETSLKALYHQNARKHR
jgi:hypothetical protein